MGTRSTTLIYEDSEKKHLLCNIYQQWDGYLSGVGKELKDLLKGKKIINGICGQTTKEAFNGMGCLAAWLIGKIKGDDIGSVYLFSGDDNVESYLYILYPDKNGNIMIDYDDYSGPIDNFNTDE